VKIVNKQISATLTKMTQNTLADEKEPQFWVFFFEITRHSGCALTKFQDFRNNLTSLPFATPQLQAQHSTRVTHTSSYGQ